MTGFEKLKHYDWFDTINLEFEIEKQISKTFGGDKS